jgi:serine/threonine-protein kinase
VAEQSSADYRGTLGRYALYGEIAAGGMATVHLARLLGPVGFAKTVAIKRLHPHLAKDPDFVAMFLEEARLAARVKHPNVVSTLDVVSEEGELFLVMEYVAGESLSRLVRKTREAGKRVSPRFVLSIMCGALDGLHAAHEAKSERGGALGLVHRDVSPQNIHVGVDGAARVLDFGIAKATNRVQETRTDQIKGKVAYMSPEQLAKGAIDRRADVYSASVCLWEALTGERLFKADDVPTLVYAIINEEIRRPSSIVPDLPSAIDEIVLKGLAREAEHRWPSAHAMAEALEKAMRPAPRREIGSWVESTAGDALAWRMELVHQIESETSNSMPPPLVRHDSPGTAFEASGVVPAEEAEAQALAPNEEGLEETETLTAQPKVHVPDEAAPAREKPQTSLVGMAAVGAGAAILMLGLVLFFLRPLHPAAEPPPAPTPSAAAPSASTDPEPAIVIGGTQRSGTESKGAVPASDTSARAAASTNKRGPTPPAPLPARRDDCENPFYVDAKGISHPKPSCFKR